ncbi:MAG: hypothetical protein BMS9Abin11_0525 [Gammaproteobacteria bacterium]|nr:MAG: hypothetical protein BMS9Abin11_0525 [Gammaproteobacteria bacterium]
MTIPHLKPQTRQRSIDVAYLRVAQLGDPNYVDPKRVLAAVQYGGDVAPVSDDSSLIHVPLRNLGQQALLEVWQSSIPVERGQLGDIHYCCNGEFLFAAIRCEESDFVELESLSYDAYQEILRFLRQVDYPHILRMWNYLADINEAQGGLERYRSFCKGRYQAFAELDPGFEQSLPAASAVGAHQPGLCVYFLAARESGLPLANPRQVNAYQYPEQYGPRSPSFSRALINTSGDNLQFYIAGTASIVGHETLHQGDVREQTLETLRNFRALHGHARDSAGVDFENDSTQILYKVFIRHAQDYPAIQQILSDKFGSNANVLYLHADICRSDLLVEIEAIYLV